MLHQQRPVGQHKIAMGSKRPPCSINYASSPSLITWSTMLMNKPWPDLLIIKMENNLLPVCLNDWMWRGAVSGHWLHIYICTQTHEIKISYCLYLFFFFLVFSNVYNMERSFHKIQHKHAWTKALGECIPPPRPNNPSFVGDTCLKSSKVKKEQKT